MSDDQNKLAGDANAEAAVLATLLLTPNAIAEWPKWFSADDFASTKHRHIAAAILELDGAGKAVDVVTVASALNQAGTLRNVGGSPYLAQLIESTPAVANVWAHAKIVADHSLRRRIVATCQTIAAEGHEASEDVEIWAQSVEARVFEAAKIETAKETTTTVADATRAELAEMKHRFNTGGAPVGISTGIDSLDSLLGRWKRKNMYVVAGRPGMGKTGFAVSSALAAGAAGEGVAFISMEMPTEQLIHRMIAQLAALDVRDIERASRNLDWEAVTGAAVQLAKLPIGIDDAPAQTVTQIRSSIRRCVSKIRKRNPDVKLGVVFIDYMQLARAVHTKGRTRENEVTEISSGILALAKEFDCAVVALAQLNRSVESSRETKKIPKLSDLRESGAIEQDAFAVLFVYRDEYYNADSPDQGIAEIVVAKVRQGGSCGTARALFHGPSTSFRNIGDIADADFDNYGAA